MTEVLLFMIIAMIPVIVFLALFSEELDKKTRAFASLFFFSISYVGVSYNYNRHYTVEVSGQDYASVISKIDRNPELATHLSPMMRDGKIVKHEYTDFMIRYNEISLEKNKAKAIRKAKSLIAEENLDSGRDDNPATSDPSQYRESPGRHTRNNDT